MMIRYYRQENVVARSVAGTNLLVPVHGCTRSVYTLNHTGAWLWNALADPQTMDQLVEAMSQDFPDARQTAGQDLQAFLADMVESGLVQAQESDA